MGRPGNYCNRCRHKWRQDRTKECPRCGSAEVSMTTLTGPSLLTKVVVLAVVVGGAYFYFSGGELPKDLPKIPKEVEELIPGKTKAKTKAKASPQGKTKTEAAPAPAKKSPHKTTPPAKKTEAQPEKPAGAHVVLKGKPFGAKIDSTYIVKGRVQNTGSKKARKVEVWVKLLGAGNTKLDEVLASCPETIKAGKTVRFKAAYRGDGVDQVERIAARVTWKGK